MIVYYGFVGVLSVLLIACIISNQVRKVYCYKEMTCTLLASLALTVFATMALHKYETSVVIIFLGLFYASVDWLLYFFIVFLNKYCYYHLFDFTRKWVLAVICAVDTINIMTNVCFGHCYKLVTMTYMGREFYVTEPLLGFRIHLIWSYILVAVVAAILISKTVYVQKFYKGKYIGILACLMTVVVGNAVYLIWPGPIDYSIIGFVLASVIVYFVAMIASPRNILNNTLMLTYDQMKQAMMIVDDRGQVIYINDLMRDFVKIVIKVELKYEMRSHFNEIFNKWCKDNFKDPSKDFDYDLNCRLDGTEDGPITYYSFKYRRLLDDKNRLICSYITIIDKTEETLKIQEQRHIATHDKLTGIYNKDRFYEQCANALRLHKDEKYVMVIANIYNFKQVNEVFGREKADNMLKNVGKAMSMACRKGDIYGRLENDKFAYFLPKSNYRELTFITLPAQIVKIDDGVSYPFPCYIGVYEIEDHDMPVRDICARALLAEESIKGDYYKRLAYYEDRLKRLDALEGELAEGLSDAIASGQIEMYLMPQFDANKKLIGAEALARWNHPEKGLLMPESFIETFERSSRICEIDQTIWEQAFATLAKWKNLGHEDIGISVNVSTKNFFFTDVYARLIDLANKYNIKPNRVTLEITEQTILADRPKQGKLIDRLRKAGFKVILDHYVNEGALMKFEAYIAVDGIKLNFGQIKDSNEPEIAKMLLLKLGKMARAVDMPVYAQYVEDEETEELLKDLGCICYQGHFYGEAVPVDDFILK